MNKDGRNLMIVTQLCTILLLASFIIASAQAQTSASANDSRSGANHTVALIPRFRLPLAPFRLRLMPSANTNARTAPGAMALMGGSNLPVLGGGTLGRLTKWTGFTSSNSSIGDTNIFEDKLGNVGIGTDSPTAKLTVAGSIQASGGSSILHRATLMGDGTAASPLSVAVPLSLTGVGETILVVRNNSERADGVFAFGGDSNTNFGGNGVTGFGGSSGIGTGGAGVNGIGGRSAL
ncbi:MAG TPA: hypothetical protein VGV87_02000, partial [Blastocatellia bacterium]|nr:hypothetical protein [Blastocatellia bacterium]